MNSPVKSASQSAATTTTAAASYSVVVNGNVNSSSDSCRCATGQVDCLKATALLKTHNSDNSKKTYVYVIDARRSDGTEYQIHRSHSDLVCLANSLPRLKELVVQKKLKKAVVPRLPDRVERTKDLSKITKYFASLLPLQDENNVVSKALNKFCLQNSSCDNCCSENVVEVISSNKKSNLKKAGSRSIVNISSPMALPSYRVTLSYKSDDKRQISLQENTIVQIYKKCPSGWWYVLSRDKSGWFPASYLELIDKTDASDDDTLPLETPERYKTTCDYKAENVDELSFSANTKVNVLLKKMDGWWIAECQGKEGYVPATFLRPCDATSVSDCSDMMCWQTMDMKLTTKRCCSEDGDLKKEGEGSSKLANGGIDLMPEKEIIREEDHKSDSTVKSGSVACSSSSSSSSINNDIKRLEDDTHSSTQDAKRENERRTQL